MKLKKIAPNDFIVSVSKQWEKDWLLLTAGDFSKDAYNMMTVGWGAFGVIWGMPMAMVLVRPVRHTYTFMEKYDTFTLCSFPVKYRKALSLCGSKSGRDIDKIAASGLTPLASSKIGAPGYAEAELIVECRKMYFDDLAPRRFLTKKAHAMYPKKDYHRMYFGEMVSIKGTSKYYV
ncbi:MAG: hypothetical protein A2268_02810 [Candidatus Raymondbacteria bacterium RifOxyA12_full_50_37]|uniref:Flavin reductase like domain-containing protein n=1 Tax=Candidatus Raymondbacteria bacterium RIFOXYD12_FULL_49_13 TaxID=1817890 RepID=A0A1F7F2H9_UNCRA|nr:MAG: hypothetical protein A2268_02810 [Candidatus Raymondbacteria bacterium RifOxyA12_full_50_37]OGJ85914.1 MAG: hypothetical protein A2248_15575 [Candidatus Raymondbacteria bacterium RIFOXYA2_FULL_49_16]OGJ91487.1 MAG: hypothetical protein A2350_02770 [Candidatus Raymondbacteria bacterium RifOxyB12_full_50_8]OGJ95908.1 MAG: hypothetical protein A2453_01135 [Candidatus Raymondbacteria bacterium RIFOXYC2_FULL_50_21]OGJ99575.1 MAG: hypothetical protein A2487_02320 [Candidatus Raymondbacteria b